MFKRNKHSLSYYRLQSQDLGELVPCGLIEVLPGDTIQHSVSALVRCSALLSPVMHPLHVRLHSWFVPMRLLWANWEAFITGGADGLDTNVIPKVTIGGGSGAAVGSLADYLGVPTGVNNIVVNALPFRAYALIWNEFYRDQDLQTKLVISTANGPDTTTSLALQNCAWEKDFYTSARPWEQKGPSITVPLGNTAPVKGLGFTGSPPAGTAGATMRESSPLANRVYPFAHQTNSNAFYVEMDQAGGASAKPMVYADLSGASAITVNALREALAFQRLEENRARFGSRYVEYLRYLGVRSSDARLQRPEYLGGGKQTIQFSEVVQTGPGADPVGDLKGHGIGALRSNRYRRYFEEHGYVITLMSVRPKTIYAQGLNKLWNRTNKDDFWQPELQHLGQQPVLNKEIYAAHASPDATFGYQDVYDEYRRMESGIAGEYRTTLNHWHFARIFGSSPALNSTFVSCVPTEVPFAVPAEDVLQSMVNHSIQARRLVASTGRSFTF